MDIQLPGMDGLAAIAILKQAEATRTIPVIALTALAMKGDASPFIARAVRAITGMVRVASACLRIAIAARPSMPGSWISMRIRFGCAKQSEALLAQRYQIK